MEVLKVGFICESRVLKSQSSAIKYVITYRTNLTFADVRTVYLLKNKKQHINTNVLVLLNEGGNKDDALSAPKVSPVSVII